MVLSVRVEAVYHIHALHKVLSLVHVLRRAIHQIHKDGVFLANACKVAYVSQVA